jgi:hypothetical protein
MHWTSATKDFTGNLSCVQALHPTAFLKENMIALAAILLPQSMCLILDENTIVTCDPL